MNFNLKDCTLADKFRSMKYILHRYPRQMAGELAEHTDCDFKSKYCEQFQLHWQGSEFEKRKRS